jgi:hypothetical protein
MARFETEILSTKENLKQLTDLSGQWIDQAHQDRKLAKLILDMDSSVSETYGHQQGSAYNGHFGLAAAVDEVALAQIARRPPRQLGRQRRPLLRQKLRRHAAGPLRLPPDRLDHPPVAVAEVAVERCDRKSR